MNWKRLRRETGLIEHICEHGVGHPNNGSAMWIAEQCDNDTEQEFMDNYGAWMVHGCDGCCGEDDFPGTLARSLRFANNLIRFANHMAQTKSRDGGEAK